MTRQWHTTLPGPQWNWLKDGESLSGELVIRNSHEGRVTLDLVKKWGGKSFCLEGVGHLRNGVYAVLKPFGKLKETVEQDARVKILVAYARSRKKAVIHPFYSIARRKFRVEVHDLSGEGACRNPDYSKWGDLVKCHVSGERMEMRLNFRVTGLPDDAIPAGGCCGERRGTACGGIRLPSSFP